jgi:hypothetical protein
VNKGHGHEPVTDFWKKVVKKIMTDLPFLENTFQINAPDVIFDVFDDEAVVMNLGTGFYYSLSKSATEIWNFFVTPSVLNESSLSILSLHRDFIDLLIDQNLILPVQVETKIVNEIVFTNGPVNITKFEDMQDLLLLDPVHDIALNNDVWPNKDNASKHDEFNE